MPRYVLASIEVLIEVPDGVSLENADGVTADRVIELGDAAVASGQIAEWGWYGQRRNRDNPPGWPKLTKLTLGDLEP